ncbi:hypothetical protein SSX86_008366 [Deinandra increscens subsp. villosa]|uniref:ENT domain-containing protein n=1 Tax=Deinandra increscens subsp. villosa TaxID=3103831 RepID=A0AAP0DB51_9ASTR
MKNDGRRKQPSSTILVFYNNKTSQQLLYQFQHLYLHTPSAADLKILSSLIWGKDTFWIMKYTGGSIVEVYCHQSWRCARVVSGKGHNYTVSYDVYPGFTNKDDVGRVSVKSIRPCAPLLEISESWVPGDVAEVFHDLSWKMAIVLKDFDWDQFLVRLVGSLHEFEVTKSELRVRQSYQDGEWSVFGKVPSDHKDANFPKLVNYDQDLHEGDGKQDFYAKDRYVDTQNNHHLLEPHIVSPKTLKRASPCCHSQDETDKKRARNLRMSGKVGRQARVPGTSPEKVDVVASRKKYINRTYGCESSSGSCSINSYKSYEIDHGSGFVEDHESDAESVCQFGYHEASQSQSQETDRSPAYDAVGDEIHRLELHAYRYTMAALHASGPLTWEKESMVQGEIDVHLLTGD